MKRRGEAGKGAEKNVALNKNYTHTHNEERRKEWRIIRLAKIEKSEYWRS